MERDLVHKFACEVFIGRDGHPTSVDFLPNDDVVDAWKVLYLTEGVDLDYFYVEHLRKRSKLWRESECQPRHIPKKEKILDFGGDSK